MLPLGNKIIDSMIWTPRLYPGYFGSLYHWTNKDGSYCTSWGDWSWSPRKQWVLPHNEVKRIVLGIRVFGWVPISIFLTENPWTVENCGNPKKTRPWRAQIVHKWSFLSPYQVKKYQLHGTGQGNCKYAMICSKQLWLPISAHDQIQKQRV